MVGALTKLFLPKEEQHALDLVTSGVSKFAARLGTADDTVGPMMGGLVDQLRGEAMLSPGISNVLGFVRQASEKGYLKIFVELGLEHLEKKGVPPSAVAGLSQRLAKHLRVEPTYAEGDTPEQTVTSTLVSIADLHYERKMGIGAISVCCNCGFAQLV